MTAVRSSMAGKREYMLLHALSMFNANLGSPFNYQFPLNLRSTLQIIPNCHQTSFNLNYLVHAYRTINAWGANHFLCTEPMGGESGIRLGKSDRGSGHEHGRDQVGIIRL